MIFAPAISPQSETLSRRPSPFAFGTPRLLGVVLALMLLADSGARAQENVTGAAKDWKKAVVTLDIKRKHYDYFQPWTRPVENTQKFGVVTGPKEILTTAEGLGGSRTGEAGQGGRSRDLPAGSPLENRQFGAIPWRV